MGKTVYIPLKNMYYWAVGHQAQRKVKTIDFKRLSKLLAMIIREEFGGRVMYTNNERVDDCFAIINKVIVAKPTEEFEKVFFEKKDEIIKSIEKTYKVNYFHGAGILDYVKNIWKTTL